MLALQVYHVLTMVVFVFAASSNTHNFTLQIRGPTSVTNIENLRITATITNIGDEDLKLLNDPTSPLSTLPGDIFTVVNSAGTAAQFKGIVAKYIPDVAAKIGAFTVLKPHESASVHHDLSDAYDLTATGAGTYTITPRDVFYALNEQDQVSTWRAYGASTSIQISVDGRLVKSRTPPSASSKSLKKRIIHNHCTDIQEWDLGLAGDQANKYTASAMVYLDSLSTPTERWNAWFGSWTFDRQATVRYQMAFLANNNFESYLYDCTCQDKGVYAYVYPQDPGTIYICGAFWGAHKTGTDSRAGTIIHEATHFAAYGDEASDWALGQGACLDLAKNDPDKAIHNADSYEYFMEDDPRRA
ncbi:hypothetical protein DFP72DRAFT_886098 [Ephemerocybe angulata]|uniref:Lysine-specific metallo-endopeptidase domain-containing protein n=1 Tax=Ephemerocybe angulata TaxID=980116 RepID=A0A8H6MCP0_9AGAR|nr:hypothetical protein DFP72DRAFT_886098 [Tulosesus angulatus]